jgi:surface polysaccharide O-acyltransferase-like enzyme
MRRESRNLALGVAIVAVVCAHVLGMCADAGFLQDDKTAQLLLTSKYAASSIGFPLLFFMFGLQVPSSLSNSRRHYLKEVLWTLAYPYLLWSLIQMLIGWAWANYENRSFPLRDLVQIGWNPPDQLWFLYAMCICALAAVATIFVDPVKDKLPAVRANRTLLVLVTLVCAGLAATTSWGVATSILLGLTFFTLGCSGRT